MNPLDQAGGRAVRFAGQDVDDPAQCFYQARFGQPIPRVVAAFYEHIGP
jgi:hypothetical protein